MDGDLYYFYSVEEGFNCFCYYLDVLEYVVDVFVGLMFFYIFELFLFVKYLVDKDI